MRAPTIRTGYESLIGNTLPDKFVATAKEDGVIDTVTKSKLTLTYKSGKKKSVKMGNWNTKEENNTAYRHQVVTNLTKGSKFKAGDTLTFDSMFFEVDVFNPTKVLYKNSTTLSVAIMETQQTYEDSGSISKSIADNLSVELVKIKSVIISNESTIVDLIKVGDKVDFNTHLFTITDSVTIDKDSFDKKAVSILQKIKNKSPRAGVRGTVEKVVIYYNMELADMTKKMVTIIEETDKELARDKNNKELNGKVSSAYSINGKPLEYGNIEVKVYINTNEGMGIGDKGIFANQLKFTVGEVFDYPIIAEDGREVEATFSDRSIKARIVNSPSIIGTTTTLLKVVAERAVDAYFK